MSSLLQQLANNESVLLMYLADELPAEDRAEVEQMLQTDARLRAELDRITVAHQSVTDAIAHDDRTLRLPPADLVLRRLSRRIRQWEVDQQVSEEPEPEVRRRWPIWGYPVAAAASIAIALLVWWAALPEEPYGPAVSPWHRQAWVLDDPTPEALELLEAFESPTLTDDLQGLYASEQELMVLQEISMFGM